MKDMTYFRKRKTLNKWNKIFLGIFLLIIFATIIFRLVISIFQDLGFAFDKFHIGFWANPQEAFKEEFNDFKATNPGAVWNDFLQAYPNVDDMILMHPNFFWMFTQFTWITTFLVFFIIMFRFFKFEERVPSWLKWIMTQKTLSLVNMYDLIVGILFWSAMYDGFNESFVGTLGYYGKIQTILVHAVIPGLLFSYSFIFLLRDERASFLRANFALKGIIFPAVYLAYYMIMTIIWNDPYKISTMHHALVKHGFQQPDWDAWTDQLWKGLLIFILIYFIMGIMSFMHNILLVSLNKKYKPTQDLDAQKSRQKDVTKIEKILIKKIYKKSWKVAYRKYRLNNG